MNKKIIILLFLALVLTSCKKENPVKINLYPAYENIDNIKKWGFINSRGDFVVGPSYDMTHNFVDGLALVEKDKLFGLVNQDGMELLKPEFTSIVYLGNGYFSGERNGKLGLYSSLGPINLDQDYLSIGQYGNGLFPVTIKVGESIKFGYIDEDGRVKVKCKYDLAHDFSGGRALVRDDKGFKIINNRGRKIKTIKHKDVSPIKDKALYRFTSTGDRYGLMDKSGKVILEEDYNWIFDIEGDQLIVSKTIRGKEKKGLIDLKGKGLLDYIYEDIYFLGGGYLGVSDGRGKLKELNYSILAPDMKPIDGKKYYRLGGETGQIESERLSVSDGSHTYLINLDASHYKSLEKIKGLGSINFDGKIFKILVDDRLLYYNIEEEIIWEESTRYKLDDKVEVVEKLLDSQENISIRYPRVIGIESGDLQEEINDYLLKVFSLDENGKGYLGQNQIKLVISYKLSSRNNLLIIEKLIESIDIKGLKKIDRNIYNLNLEDANVYGLEDLFTKDRLLEAKSHLRERLGLEDNIRLKAFKVVGDRLHIILSGFEEDDLVLDREAIIDLKDLEGFLDYNSEYFNIMK